MKEYYNEKDIEIQKDGISIKDDFFSKCEIADIFNTYVLMRNLIQKEGKK